MEKQRKREDIKLEDTWDLTLIYKTEEDFLKEIDDVKKEFPKISSFNGNILKNSNNLLKFLELSDSIERRIYKLHYYAHLNLDVDTTNTHYQELSGKVENLIQEYSLLTSFVRPELLNGDYQVVLKYLDENKKLDVYRFNLENIYRYQSHKLSLEQEEIITNFAKYLGCEEDIYCSLTDTDLTFGNINVDGQEVELTESNYSNFLENSNRDVRKAAFNRLLSRYGEFKNTIADTFKNRVEYLVSSARIRKFNSSIEASLFDDNLDISIYDNLIKTVNKHLDVLYKYYDLKKECLKLDELHLYDIYVPIVDNYEKKFSFKEAKETVLKALSVLGEDYIKNLNKAFDERWIDIYNCRGKRGGAYSSGFYDTKPYLLLNFEGKYNDVTTLAHELGHSMHTYYSCHNQPYNLSSYNIFVAEVASTVNELILVRYLLKNSSDKKEKLFLLNKLMELYKGTIYRQVMFAEFEKDMHKDSENGEILTNEYLSNKYYDLVKHYFGNNVCCDEEIKYEWCRIPHFYYDFYVYKYAIGLSSATKIVDDILSGKEGALDNYLAFLKTGGSMYPADELKVAGVDVNREELYLHAINSFNEAIDEFKKIKEEL